MHLEDSDLRREAANSARVLWRQRDLFPRALYTKLAMRPPLPPPRPLGTGRERSSTGRGGRNHRREGEPRRADLLLREEESVRPGARGARGPGALAVWRSRGSHGQRPRRARARAATGCCAGAGGASGLARAAAEPGHAARRRRGVRRAGERQGRWKRWL